ncbi:aspartate 1-decarboxylase [Flavobacteriales bacterium]|jgi:aspartate 1-decarboxylase|nr:aspartate 1-decarboxylase [Flavobacteriales bacterium]MEC8336397.1 aspartate 1-decarboxylase [Bacteroidota bacterium]MEC8663166.1 aspartate 1-decarboxylase [Bacteroidota bacterium]|tara:strand:+ start:649 stop:999 length:351 start_codon:yes stop_codon:yes gene_type:complete
MLINVMRAKLHRLTVTQADLNYIGSISLDPDLIEAAGLVEGERVQIVNINNGERLETYVITGERGTGQVCLNGPAARKVQPGDVIIVIAYGLMTPEEAKDFQPTVLFPDTATNRLA